MQRPDFVRVDYYIHNDDKIYLRGYMHSNKSVCFISLENYEPNNARLEHALIEINILNGVKDLMLGVLIGTNAQCIPSIENVIFLKKM